MGNEGEMKNENPLDQVKINQEHQEAIEIYVHGKYIDVELEVEIRDENIPDNNGERHFDVYLSFHDDSGNESQIHFVRDNEGRFSICDSRYINK
jgi:hypothetical protein